jgi:hypothetical protein
LTLPDALVLEGAGPPAPHPVAARATAVQMPPRATSLEMVFRVDIAVDSLSLERSGEMMWGEKSFCQNDLAQE